MNSSKNESSADEVEEESSKEDITEVTEEISEEVTDEEVAEEEASAEEEEDPNNSQVAPDPEKCFQSDEDYFRGLPDKEFRWLSKNEIAFGEINGGTYKCTACFKQINPGLLERGFDFELTCRHHKLHSILLLLLLQARWRPRLFF